MTKDQLKNIEYKFYEALITTINDTNLDLSYREVLSSLYKLPYKELINITVLGEDVSAITMTKLNKTFLPLPIISYGVENFDEQAARNTFYLSIIFGLYKLIMEKTTHKVLTKLDNTNQANIELYNKVAKDLLSLEAFKRFIKVII